jgi:hypothetical protein
MEAIANRSVQLSGLRNARNTGHVCHEFDHNDSYESREERRTKIRSARS